MVISPIPTNPSPEHLLRRGLLLTPSTPGAHETGQHELQPVHNIKLELQLIVAGPEHLADRGVTFITQRRAQLHVQREQSGGEGLDVVVSVHARVR